MQTRRYITALLAVLLVSLAFASSAEAQQKYLPAGPHIAEWTSKPRHSLSFVHIYLQGEELEQRYQGGCRARYGIPGFSVSARVTRCGKDGAFRIKLRYRAARPIKFLVRITDSSTD